MNHEEDLIYSAKFISAKRGNRICLKQALPNGETCVWGCNLIARKRAAAGAHDTNTSEYNDSKGFYGGKV